MSLNDVYELIPAVVGNRFRFLQPFVRESLFPKDRLDRTLQRIRPSQSRKQYLELIRLHVENATLLALMYSLSRLFEEGHRAAIAATDELRSLGIDEFRIGRIAFSGRNENVMAGKILRDSLLESISDAEAKRIILEAKTLSGLVESYRHSYVGEELYF